MADEKKTVPGAWLPAQDLEGLRASELGQQFIAWGEQVVASRPEAEAAALIRAAAGHIERIAALLAEPIGLASLAEAYHAATDEGDRAAAERAYEAERRRVLDRGARVVLMTCELALTTGFSAWLDVIRQNHYDHLPEEMKQELFRWPRSNDGASGPLDTPRVC
jgi:hypothetical protein